MKWFKDTDWSFVGLMIIFVLIVGGIFGYAAYSNETDKQKSAEEKLRIEEFTYKGHQYIKFKERGMFGGSNVVHDPNCVCQTMRDTNVTVIP